MKCSGSSSSSSCSSSSRLKTSSSSSSCSSSSIRCGIRFATKQRQLVGIGIRDSNP